MLVKARPMKKLCEYEGKALPQVTTNFLQKKLLDGNQQDLNIEKSITQLYLGF
jgi:hypothetical protein